MAKTKPNPYSDQRREQHPVTFVQTQPPKSVATALNNAKKQARKK